MQSFNLWDLKSMLLTFQVIESMLVLRKQQQHLKYKIIFQVIESMLVLRKHQHFFKKNMMSHLTTASRYI